MKNKNNPLQQHLDRPVNLEKGSKLYLAWNLERVSEDRFRVSDFEFDTKEIESVQASWCGLLSITIIS